MFVFKRSVQQPNPVDTKTELDTLKTRLKASFRSELTKLNHVHEIKLSQLNSQLNASQAELKSLENEFRSALLIEATRQSELSTKIETIAKECNELKVANSQLEAAETRNKSLIKELNELIREQKLKLQELSKLRQEASTSVQSRSEALKEAVADCGKLKSQLDEVKKEKVNFKLVLRVVLLKSVERVILKA